MTKNLPCQIVMLIDDDLFDQKLYARILKRSGIEIDPKFFETAPAALEWMKGKSGHDIDLIFLDINMPGMSGFDFLDEAYLTLKGWFKDSIVVMLTTSEQPEDKRKAMSYSVVKDYLIKPLTVDKLTGAIELARSFQHRNETS